MYINTNVCLCVYMYVGAVNILQQITEFSSEAHNAVTSMVAMAPGTVAVVEQVNNLMCLSLEIMRV